MLHEPGSSEDFPQCDRSRSATLASEALTLTYNRLLMMMRRTQIGLLTVTTEKVLTRSGLMLHMNPLGSHVETFAAESFPQSEREDFWCIICI